MPAFEVKFKSAIEPLDKKEKMWVNVINRMYKDTKLMKYYSQKAKERAEDFRIEKINEEWKNILQS